MLDIPHLLVTVAGVVCDQTSGHIFHTPSPCVCLRFIYHLKPQNTSGFWLKLLILLMQMVSKQKFKMVTIWMAWFPVHQVYNLKETLLEAYMFDKESKLHVSQKHIFLIRSFLVAQHWRPRWMVALCWLSAQCVRMLIRCLCCFSLELHHLAGHVFHECCYIYMLYIYIYIFVFLNFDGTNYAPFCGDIDKPLRLGIRYFSLSDAMYALRKQIVLAERHGLFRAASAATITKHFLSMMLSCFKKPSDPSGCLSWKTKIGSCCFIFCGVLKGKHAKEILFSKDLWNFVPAERFQKKVVSYTALI